MPHEGHSHDDDHVHSHDHAHSHDHDHTHPHDHDHAHSHDRDHTHPHGHDHAHSHDQTHAPGEHHHHHGEVVRRPDLARGAAVGKTLYFDAPSGLAGDMTIASLVDLGVPETVIAEAVSKLPITGYALRFGTRVRSGIVATLFDVEVEGGQPERTYREVRSLIESADLDSAIKARALATFRLLAESEAKVHRAPIDDVHFHEVGAVDALVDIVGSAAALGYLGGDVFVSPLPLGRGYVKARHGTLPLPAPATVECLRGLATYDGGKAFEFVTPTGAAIMGAHARSSEWPSFAPETTGFGSGHMNLDDRPNLLRVILGTKTASSELEILEANLDDATGELLAHAIEQLLDAGALDAWATPITMKKGRPATTLSALVEKSAAVNLASVMLCETTTLGVRRIDANRIERPRETVLVATPYGDVPVKIARGPFGPPQIKPEFEICKKIARERGIPLREVLRIVMASAESVAKASLRSQ